MCFTNAAEALFFQRNKRLRKTATTVCQSKEDLKQWNGDKKRKWSHTFSTCPKTSHPHAVLLNHGSCCHVAHVALSFLRHCGRRLSSPDRLNMKVFDVFVCLFTGSPVHRRRSSFIYLVEPQKTVQVTGQLSIWQTDEAVFTHS